MAAIDYFFKQTNLDSDIVVDKWDYPAASVTGNFSSNSGSNAFSRTVSGNNLVDFSLFFTFDKKTSSFNNKGVNLFTNASGQNAGFDFGIDQNNFLFLKTSPDCYTFDKINLAEKNLVAFQKAGNAFSILHYDLNSSGIIENQTVFVNPSIGLSGSGYSFGKRGFNVSGVNNFYGYIDQMMLLSEKVSTSAATTLFSGFSALSVTSGNFGYYEVVSDEWFLPEPQISSGLQTLLRDYFTGVHQDYVIDEGLNENEQYLSKIIFSGNGSYYDTINYYSLDAQQFCGSGTFYPMGDPEIMATGFSLPNQFTVNGNFALGPFDLTYSSYLSKELFFTYSLDAIQPGLRYTNLMELVVEETLSQATNTGYFTGFEMKGILAPNADLVFLASVSGTSDQIGQEAIFDSTQGLFYGDIPTGNALYLNGVIVASTGFSLQSGQINIYNYIETSADEIIFDTKSGISPISLSNSSSTTGDFWKKTSFAATGEYSFSQLNRISEGEYLETHPYHLYHNKNWQDSSAEYIFENLDENWA